MAATIHLLVTLYLAGVGLAVGSFVNLAADRLPRGESVIHPASHCTACGRRLNAVDLLPVLGYVVRGGKCAACRTPIGISSPVIEAVCGAIMLVPILWVPGWVGATVGASLTAGFGAGVIVLSMLRRPRPGSRPDAGSAPSPLAR